MVYYKRTFSLRHTVLEIRQSKVRYCNVNVFLYNFDISIQARYWSDCLENQYRPAPLPIDHCFKMLDP